MRKSLFPGALLAVILPAITSYAQSVFINEIHYDNSSADAGEGVEIAGPSTTNLTDYSLVFYNGTGGTIYDTVALSGTIPNQQGGYGAVWFARAGIQNGNPDGLALVQGATVIQFLSYGGTFTAVGGAANGMVSTNIGRSESGSTPVGHSLQLSGSGTQYANFSWQAPAAATTGTINTGQSFGGGPVYNTTLTVTPSSFTETAGAQAATATLTITPAPAAPVTGNLINSDSTEISIPASVVVPISGTITFDIAAATDGIIDGAQSVTITASIAGNIYPNQQATVTVQDADVTQQAPRPVIRVATLNVLNGIGNPGSAEFLAVKSILDRINPDIIAFEELTSASNFADLKSLATSLGIATTRQHVAYEDDLFIGNFRCGDTAFSTGTQCIGFISRFPITRTVQIGRGATDGRQEMARYPVYVEVDVPGVAAADDPVLVAVHLKASDINDAQADKFRRALESWRITQFLQSQNRTGLNSNIMILGDFNEQDYIDDPPSFTTNFVPSSHTFSDGSALPASYALGTDITGANAVTIPYAGFPHPVMAAINASTTGATQADPSQTSTFITTGNSRLDYIFFSQPKVDAELTRLEVYNSRLENGFDGMKKYGTPPAPNTSALASDHFAVFGDFALDSRPVLSVSLSQNYVMESAPGIVNATITLSQAPSSTLTVQLTASEAGRVAPLPPAIFNPGETQKIVPVPILHPTSIAAHRAVAIHASADGWFPGQDNLEIRNYEAAGRLLLTQYTDPTGSDPKAIEVLNRDFPALDFSQQNLIIRRYSNGSTVPEKEATISSGILEQGAVLVIGGTATRDYLLAQNLIIPSATQAFTNTNGQLRFWLDSFTYNGDDALELLLDYERQDVLGVVGQDPGTAWSGNGVSTADQNIALKSGLATGSEGLADPSCRFVTVGSGNTLTDFGIAPTLADPYLTWSAAFTLPADHSPPLSDADGDGWSNLLEFALLTSPSSGAVPTLVPGMERIGPNVHATLQFTHRTDDPTLTFLVETSPNLQSWVANASLTATVNHNNGTQTVTYRAPGQVPASRMFIRIRISRD